jgi:RNA ligase
MNYQFPEIYHIDDVLNHIQDYDEIRVTDKGDYIVINYAVAFENTFTWNSDDPYASSIRRECRGLIFNKDGKLISRPYHKFFNAGEREETQLNRINLHEPHVVLEKLDGSMIRPIPTADSFRLATKAGVTDISQQAEEFIADKPHYAHLIHKCILMNVTPIFEWVSRKNRIVVDYPTDNLILAGMRYNSTGLYVGYKAMEQYATAWNIPVVKVVDGLSVQNIELFVKQVREWEDNEGIVLRFDTGHMIKVKADDYILRHRSKESINQEKNVILTIINDQVDDVIPLLTIEDADNLKKFQENFWYGMNETICMLEKIYAEGNIMYANQKDFAVEFVNKMLPISHRQFMFGMRQGKNVKDMIIVSIQKLNTQARIDECRWLWGNHKWN